MLYNKWGSVVGGAAFAVGIACVVFSFCRRSQDEAEKEFSWPKTHRCSEIFTPDGSHVVGYGVDSATNKGVINFWEVSSQRLVQTIIQPSYVWAIVFSPDGKRLLTISSDSKIRSYQGPKWAPERTFKLDQEDLLPGSMAIMRDGKRLLVSAHGFGKLRSLDLDSGKSTALKPKNEIIRGLSVSVDGKRFAVQYGQSIEIYDADKGNATGTLKLEKEAFINMVFSPNGKWIATATTGQELTIWDTATYKVYKTLGFAPREPVSAIFTRDDKLLVLATEAEGRIPAELTMWSVEGGHRRFSFTPHKTSNPCLELSSDGRWLITGGTASVRIWDFDAIRRRLTQFE